VRLQGEDVKRGSELIATGHEMTAGRISLLAAQGRAEVRVGRRPVTGVVATGNELREAGQSLAAGQIYESNRAGLAALIRSAGASPHSYPLVSDSLAETKAALAAALTECDVVVSSGGVSVGEFDFVKKAFQEIGGQLDFWRVAIRPGKPFLFGRRGNKFLFGVPGNPVSAFVTFQMLIRPALLKLQGAAMTTPRTRHGILAEELANHGDRRHFLRVRVDWEARVHSAGAQASHCLGSLAQANGLLDVPPRTIWEVGKAVRVIDLA
ncbi:MAG: molybdopterin molybdotransferase MoeA, partial [Verrucomicrobia bacterium]|nr:molybdopterin molybdotransferase MoeA [Verrucomicrobiota bacterium]